MKLYVSEPESNAATRLVDGRNDLVVSDLAVTESASALARRVREGSITAETARRVYRAIVQSLDAAPYHRAELTRDVHRRAEQLLLTVTSAPFRAADALHLALALSVRAASMVAFDARLAAAARTVGLAVSPS